MGRYNRARYNTVRYNESVPEPTTPFAERGIGRGVKQGVARGV